jgi:pimeloyl-ACP methyl ester carboxylesterase
VTVTAADGPVFWQDLSQGPRPALAIHCALAHSAEWAGVAERLSGLRFRAFDLPGHGLSADWPGGGDYLAASLGSALNFMDEPVDLIGHSLGGVVALAAAEARPEAVRSLTLIEPVLFGARRNGASRGTTSHPSTRPCAAATARRPRGRSTRSGASRTTGTDLAPGCGTM